MCTEEQHQEKMTALARIEKMLKPRPPIDYTVMIADHQGYIFDYRNRKHVFIWLPSTSLTLVFGQFGTCVVATQVWVNLGIQEGLEVVTSGQSTPTVMYVRCTDEVIP